MRTEADARSPSELPYGWAEQHDAASGRTYWLHNPTDRISYRRPRRPLPAEPVETADLSSRTAANPILMSPGSTSARGTRPDSTSSLPGISQSLIRRRPSLPTAVASTSSLPVPALDAIRTPPPPYDPSPANTGGTSLLPPLVPLPSSPLSFNPPLSPFSASNRRAIPSSRSEDLPSSSNRVTAQNHIATQTSPRSSTGSPSVLPPLPPLHVPGIQNALGLDLPQPALPAAPVLSSATTPASIQSITPRFPNVPSGRLPPLPPVPPELLAERRRGNVGRSSSARVPSATVPHHVPGRSYSDPVTNPSLSSPANTSSRPLGRTSPFLAVPSSPTVPAPGGSRHITSTPFAPMSPSARSDRSIASGTTVALDSDSDGDRTNVYSSPSPFERNNPIFTNGRPSSPDNASRSGIPLNSAQTELGPLLSSTSMPIERSRRPYNIAGSVDTAPADSTGSRTRRQDPRGTTRTDRPTSSSRRTSFPQPREGRQTGLTPDMEELSSFSGSPRLSSADPPRSSTYPATPHPRRSPRSTYIDSSESSAESDDNIDVAAAIRDSMPNPGRSGSARHTNSRNRRMTPEELRQAENFASDLADQVSSSTNRSQKLLNDIWKIKLEKAKRKIEELQDKLADLGRRDAPLERELERERNELEDWEIAKLDDGIMRDLGAMTEAEYARLKRELDREMTIDELRKKLNSYEPLHYDSDPFAADAAYQSSARPSRRHRDNDGYRPLSPGFDDYFPDDTHRRPPYFDDHPDSYPEYTSLRPDENYRRSYNPHYPPPRCPDTGNDPACSCIRTHGHATCKKPYTHRLQLAMDRSTYRRPSTSELVYGDAANHSWDGMPYNFSGGYASADEDMFANPRRSPVPSVRRRSTSSLRPRPILRQRSFTGRPRNKNRGRRVSFEDELDLGDDGVSMFRTTPSFTSSRYP